MPIHTYIGVIGPFIIWCKIFSLTKILGFCPRYTLSNAPLSLIYSTLYDCHETQKFQHLVISYEPLDRR